MFNQPKMAKWLLDHGAIQNPKYDGKTPLAMALEKKYTELVEILRSHGGMD
jgi:ankyrin repeat protein